MAIRSYTRAFNGGEISPAMFARIDDAKYQTGLAVCKNFLIEPQGPVVSRPGFEFVSEVKDSTHKPKLIPFTFSNTQTMVLEFGERYIRFHTQGKPLLDVNGERYEIETPYSASHVYELHYVQSADVLTIVHPSYPPMELRRYGPTDWRLVEIKIASTLMPPTNLKAVQTINGEVTNKTDYKREYAVTSLLLDGSQESVRSTSVSVDCNPYGDGAYNTISWDMVEGAGLYRIYRNQGGVWAYIGQTNALSIIDENIDPDASITPPLYDDAFKQAAGIESIEIVNGGSGYVDTTAVVTSLDFDNAKVAEREWNSNKVRFELLYENKPYNDFKFPVPINMTVAYPLNHTITISDSAVGGIGAVVEPIIYSTPDGIGYQDWWLDGFKLTSVGSGYENPVATCYIHTSTNPDKWYYRFTIPLMVRRDVYRHEIIVTDKTGYGFEGYAISVGGVITTIEIVSPGSNYTDPTVTIVGAGTGCELKANVNTVGDYPGSVTYFEQRRWFGGTYTRPNNLWATKSGTESDMSYSLPSQDDDRIAVRVAAREASRIQHIVPLSQLMLLTGTAEWRVSPLNSDAITPSSMSVRPQSYVGASSVQPLVINSSMIYGASRGGHLRECGYNWQAGGFVSADVSLRAPHLFDNLEIVDMAYAKAPWPIIWVVSSNGKLISFTYVPDQAVGAFSTVETAGDIESCCVVAEGEEDILYCTIRRDINGKVVRFVERMHERQYTDLRESIHLDCAGTYRGDKKDVISGLTWLEGMKVDILADGGVHPSQVVVDGTITLNEPAAVVHIGLPYNSDLKTLPAAMALQDGSFGSGHRKNVRQVFFRVLDSSGVQTGPSFDELTEYPARDQEAAGSAPDPINDEIGFSIEPMWSNSGQVCVRQAYPLPLRIISMTVDMEMA